MSDGEPILGSVPMDVVTGKKPDSTMMPEKTVETEEVQVMTESHTWDAYTAEEARYLVEQRDNPEAQLAATMLMANEYRGTNEYYLEVIKAIDLTAVADKLGLDKKTEETMTTKRTELVGRTLEFQYLDNSRLKAIQEQEDILYIDKQEIQERINKLSKLTEETRENLQILYRELMLPVRTAVLNSQNMSEDYKKKAIRGINFDNGPLLEPERQLLKDYYPRANEQERHIIRDVVASYVMRENIHSLDVEDLMELGIFKQNTAFALVWNNPKVTSEVVEKKVATIFFPEEDPKKVSSCWKMLQKITPHDRSGSWIFLVQEELMSVEIFKGFMDNAEELLPVVEMLSDYGFQYQLVTPDMVNQVYPEYIRKLKELNKELPELKQQLDVVRNILPEYEYNPKIEIADHLEPLMEVNPFSVALENISSKNGVRSQWGLDQYTNTFNSLVAVVPEKWRSGLLTTYINRLSVVGDMSSNSELSRAAVLEANKWVFDTSLTADNITIFGKRFFEASLQPQNDNTKVLYEFCKQYADRIPLWNSESKKLDIFNKDQVWWEFILSTSDLYRYQFVSGNAEEIMRKSVTDLVYASEAVFQISDPQIKDQAISNVIYMLTDEELGELEVAQLYVDMMQEGSLKREAQTEVSLELERLNRGESTSWKKMEKLRRVAIENKLALQKYLGYEPTDTGDVGRLKYTENRAKQLREEINRVENDFSVTVNITWENLLKALDNGRLVSIWENNEKMKQRKSNYAERRDTVERMLGNRAKGGRKDPHPIYGAAFTPNGRDEFYGGSGGGYGECFIELDTARIKKRTSFCYGDSFGDYGKWLLDWEGGVVAKAIHNLDRTKETTRHAYVEAQILGGVSLDDIESINIPQLDSNHWGTKGEEEILSEIEELKQRFPGIKINIIEVPTK